MSTTAPEQRVLPRRRSPLRSHVVLAGLVVLLVALVAGLAQLLPSRAAVELLHGTAQALVSAVVGVVHLARRRAISSSWGRASGGALGAGALVWSLSQVTFVVTDVLVVPDAVAVLAESGFVLAAALLLVAGVCAVQATVGERRGPRGLVDGLVLALGVTTVSWVTWLGDGVDAQVQAASGFVLPLAIPFLDLAFTATVFLTVAVPRARAREVLLLTASVALTAADGLYLAGVTSPQGFRTGGPADLLWLLGWGLLAAAAVGRPRSLRRERDAFSPVLLLVPYAMLLPAYVLGVLRLWTRVDHVLLSLLLAQSLLVMVRQLLALLDHRRLLQVAHDQRAALDHLAHVDTLTGLVNRRRFSERLDAAVREGAPVVAFVDLDRFKDVNDTLGHQAGDELLRAVADRLAGCVRAQDCVARWGGDEFAVLVTDPAATPEDVVARLRAVVGRPFRVAGRVLAVSASIGAVRDADGRTLSGADALLAAADDEMYLVKGAGRLAGTLPADLGPVPAVPPSAEVG